MQLLGRLLARWIALAAVAALAACSHSNNNTTATGNVRLINASSGATITVSLNGVAAFTSVAPNTSSNYVVESAGTYTVTATSSSGAVASVTPQISVAAGYFSIIAYDRDGALFLSTIGENTLAPAAGTATLGFANASPDSGPLDVYVVLAGTTNLSSLAPTYPNVASLATSPLSLVSGTAYDIYAAAANTKAADIRFSVKNVTLATASVQYMVFTGTPAGSLVNGVLITQQGSITFTNNANARVRVISALPFADGTQVTFSSGGTTLQPVSTQIFLPYALITGSATGTASTYAINVGGVSYPTAGALPAASFVAGGDFTVVVYGTTAAPLFLVLTDTNQAAGGTGSFQANVRFVNVGVPGPVGLTLYPNSSGTAVATGITYGTASAYAGVKPALSNVEVLLPGQTPATASFTFGSGSVYSVYVLDASMKPYFVQDR